MATEKQKKQKFLGALYLVIWAMLIVAGIVTKRVFGRADWMVMYHLPAAVFLVMGFKSLSTDFSAKYRESIRTKS